MGTVTNRVVFTSAMRILVLVHPFHSALFILALFTYFTSAQVLFNGQVFTDGLAIVDAPAPNSQLSAGSDLNLAIDVSGDGLLSPLASVPGSGLATGFDSLDVFLVSYQTQLNITVSTGPDLLTQEPGSTVKHLNFPIPSCVPPGQYNLTFYEESHIDDVPFFSITPLPIIINNPNLSGSCAPGSNPLQPFPQSSSPPSQNPVSPTVTITQSSIPTTVSFPSFTTTVSVSIPTTTTIVSISSSVSTTTVVSVLTTPAITATTTTSSAQADGTPNFFPVNGALSNLPPHPLSLTIGICALLVFWETYAVV